MNINLLLRNLPSTSHCVGKQFAEQIPPPSKSINHYMSYTPNNPKTIFLNPASPTEIEKIINNLPNKHSSGHDDLSNVLLKLIKNSITYPLTIIINQSLTKGEFPHGMKAADVTPLYKSKERYMVTNYRPISLTNYHIKNTGKGSLQ